MQPIPQGLPEAPQWSRAKCDSPTHATRHEQQRYTARGYLRALWADSPLS